MSVSPAEKWAAACEGRTEPEVEHSLREQAVDALEICKKCESPCKLFWSLFCPFNYFIFISLGNVLLKKCIEITFRHLFIVEIQSFYLINMTTVLEATGTNFLKTLWLHLGEIATFLKRCYYTCIPRL